MPSVHLIIKGKVQGVYYRASARDVALGLSVTGWIKNTMQGHVEAFVTGPQDALQQFTDWCRQGPAGAAVTDIVIESMPEIAFPDFAIRRG
ncbi:MAG TPA: acylphosphatase [Puia sp.]|nr:acylphosphatase [Puia sp.]